MELENLLQELRELTVMRERMARLEEELREVKAELASQPLLLTTREFCRRYGWTMGTLRDKLFYRKQLGLEKAIHQGRKRGTILIDPAAFFAALKQRPRRMRS